MTFTKLIIAAGSVFLDFLATLRTKKAPENPTSVRDVIPKELWP
jgi:hypothetical protein